MDSEPVELPLGAVKAVTTPHAPIGNVVLTRMALGEDI
jgi:hypothetical protein